jgi:hypothetical protein
MSNSPLAAYTKLSPSCNKPRNHVIDTITPHTMAGNMSARACAEMFANPALQTSCNYAIGSDGEIALIVEECNRSWCTSNAANDHRAITVEIASLTKTEPFPCSNQALDAAIALFADVCGRNVFPHGLLWLADQSLVGQTSKQNMSAHRWFAAKSCPGDYLFGMFGEIAQDVNKRLGMPDTSAPATPPRHAPIGVGSRVMITGDRYSTGGVIPGWAKTVPHTVSRIDGAKALLGAEGGINSWVPREGVGGG